MNVNAALAALPGLLTIAEQVIAWVQASQEHTDEQKAAELDRLRARLLETMAKVEAARPRF